jgi:hypothetical protein
MKRGYHHLSLHCKVCIIKISVVIKSQSIQLFANTPLVLMADLTMPLTSHHDALIDAFPPIISLPYHNTFSLVCDHRIQSILFVYPKTSNRRRFQWSFFCTCFHRLLGNEVECLPGRHSLP